MTKKSSKKKPAKKPVKKLNKNIKKAAKKTTKKPIQKTKKKVVKAKPKKDKTSVKALPKKTVKPKKKALVKIKKATEKPVAKTGIIPSTENTSSFVQHKTHLRTGNTAPYFEGIDQHGNTINLYSLSGKTVVLFFYPKDDTEGCVKEACSLRDEYKFLIDNNYAVIGVSADDINSHSRFAKKYNLPYPLIADVDKTMIMAYDVWGQKMVDGKITEGIVRTTFIIDGYGIIQNVITEVDTANHAKQILAL